MPLLQKEFRGLKGFLGLFTGGSFPLEPGQTLVPTMEMEDWLAPNNWSAANWTLADDHNKFELTVPENEFWRMKWASVHVSSGSAVDSVIMLIKSFDAGGSVWNFPLVPFNFQDLWWQNRAGNNGGYAVPLDKLNMQPGERIGVRRMSSSGAGNVTGGIFLQYQKIDI